MSSRILIVEDEPLIAGGLQDDLRLEGYDVTVVDDGLTASKRATREPFDLDRARRHAARPRRLRHLPRHPQAPASRRQS